LDDEDVFGNGYGIGGSLGRQEIELAAQLASLGLPLDKLLSLKDPFEINIYVMIANRIQELRKHDQEQLAIAIANKVGAMLQKAFKK
jgi:hypothetical protein